jgi:hypothetical protein
MMEKAEATHGRQYTHVFRTRPDLLWLAPLPPFVANTSIILYQYDIVGVCPRASTGPDWPCDVPNSNGDRSLRGVAADPETQDVFQVSFERMRPRVTQNERHLEWAAWYAGSLAGNLPNSTAARSDLVYTFLADICFKYEFLLHDYVWYNTPKNASFVPPDPTSCSEATLEASQWYLLAEGLADKDATAQRLQKLQFGPIAGHYFQHDTSETAVLPELDKLCGCRWRFCGRKLTAVSNAAAFAQRICAHEHRTPFNDRRFF